MFKRIKLIEGSSTDENTINQITEIAKNYKTVMVFLDSLHTHDHVLAEMNLYSQFVTVGSYMVLPDTFIEFFPKGYYRNRPWDVGNNPHTALREFMKNNNVLSLIPTLQINSVLLKQSTDTFRGKVILKDNLKDIGS